MIAAKVGFMLCGGFTNSQYTKINKDNNWIKCIVCCLHQIQLGDSEPEDTSLFNLVTAAARHRLEEAASARGGKSKRTSFSSVPSVSKVVSSEGTPDSGSVHKTPKSGTVYHSVHSASGKLSGRKEYSSKDNCLSQPEYISCCSLTNEQACSAQSGCNSPSALDSQDLKPKSNPEEKLVISSEVAVDNILIVDNINNPAEFTSSKRILKEVNLFCPEVKVEFAYSLAKGGVAIHTADKSGRDFLLDKLPKESFGGGIKHFPKYRCVDTVFVKGVCTSVSSQEFETSLKGFGIDTVEVRRLRNRRTGKPIRVFKVKCSQESASLLLARQLVVKNVACVIERQSSTRVVRCYRCQSFGHLAKVCNTHRRCELCAGLHEFDEQCCGEVRCANCGGNHPASSAKCPAYISRYEIITKQHSERQYVSVTAAAYNAETSN